MLNAGWNEVIWPSACFHLWAEETVSQPLPFPTHRIALSFSPCKFRKKTLTKRRHYINKINFHIYSPHPGCPYQQPSTNIDEPCIVVRKLAVCDKDL